MRINQLAKNNSVLNTFLAEIRDVDIQHDRMRFRRNIERIGEILSYELSQSLNYNQVSVSTPLGEKQVSLYKDEIVICSILRAGLPLHHGVLNYFDTAENAFISAYRKHEENSNAFEVKVEYAACPSIEDKTLILVDPMLATGQSLVLTYQLLLQFGTPKYVHLMSVIGAAPGVDYVSDHFPKSSTLWVGDIDPELNEKGYIIPGLGDAGDLAYGEKLQK